MPTADVLKGHDFSRADKPVLVIPSGLWAARDPPVDFSAGSSPAPGSADIYFAVDGLLGVPFDSAATVPAATPAAAISPILINNDRR